MRPACLVACFIVAAAVTSCGIETLVVERFDGEEHVLPTTKISGRVANTPETIVLIRADGETVEPESIEIEGGKFTAEYLEADYPIAKLVAAEGERVLTAYVPTILIESENKGIEIDGESTAKALAIDVALSAADRAATTLDPVVVANILERLGRDFDNEGPARDLKRMVDRLLEAADPKGDGTLFDAPQFDAEFTPSGPTINPDWLSSHDVDYDDDGDDDEDAAAFDTALGLTAKSFLLDGCLDPDFIRVVFEVDFNDGRLDDNCDSIQRFRWVRDEPDKQMFFTGGIHKDSTLQDDDFEDIEIEAMLGGWIPNQLPMYDDGTNGDEASGDNIWTVSFAIPKGLRVSYKYTWGKQGQLWGGTEEWPGNQHILEIVDVNGDNFVRRRDDFADEATNKDIANLNRSGSGEVTWDTDVNEDGIPDSRERPIDVDNDCELDEWQTPTAIGPATIECKDS